MIDRKFTTSSALFTNNTILISKFRIFVNKSFKTSSDDTVNHSSWQPHFEAKEFSHVKSESETTGQNVLTFYDGSNHPQLKMQLRNKSFILNE